MEVGFYSTGSAFNDYHAQYASMPAGGILLVEITS